MIYFKKGILFVKNRRNTFKYSFYQIFSIEK